MQECKNAWTLWFLVLPKDFRKICVVWVGYNHPRRLFWNLRALYAAVWFFESLVHGICNEAHLTLIRHTLYHCCCRDFTSVLVILPLLPYFIVSDALIIHVNTTPQSFLPMLFFCYIFVHIFAVWITYTLHKFVKLNLSQTHTNLRSASCQRMDFSMDIVLYKTYAIKKNAAKEIFPKSKVFPSRIVPIELKCFSSQCINNIEEN